MFYICIKKSKSYWQKNELFMPKGLACTGEFFFQKGYLKEKESWHVREWK